MTMKPIVVWQTGSRDPLPPCRHALRLYVNLSPPEFMSFTFVMLYGGSEEIYIEADTRADLDEVIAESEDHPRFRRWSITTLAGIGIEKRDRQEARAQRAQKTSQP